MPLSFSLCIISLCHGEARMIVQQIRHLLFAQSTQIQFTVNLPEVIPMCRTRRWPLNATRCDSRTKNKDLLWYMDNMSGQERMKVWVLENDICVNRRRMNRKDWTESRPLRPKPQFTDVQRWGCLLTDLDLTCTLEIQRRVCSCDVSLYMCMYLCMQK